MLTSLSDRALNRLSLLLLFSGLVCIVAMVIEFVVTIFMWVLAASGSEAIILGGVAVTLALLVAQFYTLVQVATWLSDGAFPRPDQRPAARRQLAVVIGVVVWLLMGTYAALSWREPGWLGIGGWMVIAALFCFAVATVALIGVVRISMSSPLT